MAEEEQQDETGANEAPQLSEAEQQARSRGWRPKDEWEGEADDWVDYREFNFRGNLMRRINEQSSILENFKNQISERDKALEDMRVLNEKIAEREYSKIMNQLKKDKAEAVQEGDGDKVVEIDEEMDLLRQQEQERKKVAEKPEAPAQNPQTPPELAAWISDPANQWYTSDTFMRSVADALAANILRESPNLHPSELLARLDRDIRKELPHKFKGRTSVDDGGGDRTQRSRGRKPSYADLTAEQKEVCDRLVKTKTLTREKYIDQMIAIGEL